ncbi:MAG: topology modulation protein [Bacteriovoracia bacterium]
MKTKQLIPTGAEILESQGVPSAERIVILGNAGAGKSTLSKELGSKLDIRPTHLDQLYWQSGNTHLTDEEFTERHQQALGASRWIFDGNYLHTLSERVASADTVVFLDLPLRICVPRIIKRRMMYRPASPLRPQDGSADRLTPTLLKYVFQFNRTRRPTIVEKLKALEAQGAKKVYWLRTLDDVEVFRKTLRL